MELLDETNYSPHSTWSDPNTVNEDTTGITNVDGR